MPRPTSAVCSDKRHPHPFPGRSARLQASACADSEAAVNVEAMAGDVLCAWVEGEVLDDACDLLRCPEAPERDVLSDRLEDFRRHRRTHVGLNEAGGDGVDDDAAGAELARH